MVWYAVNKVCWREGGQGKGEAKRTEVDA